jgi:hypothetical protein
MVLEFSTVRNKQKTEDKKPEVPEDIKKYLRIKEKTVGDTIQFVGDSAKAIGEIIEGYENELLNRIINKDIVKELSDIVNKVCNKNLRTFIFAVQKMVDITDNVNISDFDDDFFICLLFGIIHLSESIKTGEFPKWEGAEYLSTKLGSNDTPLMRFAYDYVRWQTFDIETVQSTYKAYKEFKLLDKHMEYKDADMNVLNQFYIETEGNVLNALINLEQKLQQPDAIGIYAYSKLAYYVIYVGDVVGFDSGKSRNLMLKNATEIGKKTSIDAKLLFEHQYDFVDDKLKEKYNDFIRELCEALKADDGGSNSLYDPDLYDDIYRNIYKYTSGHRFMSKYDQNKILGTLLNCSAEQIDKFREILFAVYRYAGKNEFDENDSESMKELLVLLKNVKCGDHHWDKIQLLQIKYLCINLEQFINQMS